MSEQIIVTLERPARKQGGDRYENKEQDYVIYIPQWISRADDKPAEKIKITFEVVQK